MDCEICGQPHAKNTIVVDGQKMLVCSECTSFGKIIDAPMPLPVPAVKNSFGGFAPKQFVRETPKNDLADFSAVEGFGKKIMQARQKKGLTIQELALEVFEKESVMHKIEQEKTIPDQKLAKKIESFLGIKIIE